MSVTDSPDWQNVVTIKTGGTVTDAPDWSEVVTGPGGGPVPGGGLTSSLLQPFFNSGHLGVTMHPYTATGGASLLGGTLYIMPFAAAATGAANNVTIPVTTGVALTSTTTFAGIYDWGQATAGTMTLLASSASGAAATAWASSGLHAVSMATPPTLTAGQTYAVAAQINGATLAVEGFTIGGITTGGLATYPVGATASSGGTSLPATITFVSASIALRTFLAYVN